MKNIVIVGATGAVGKEMLTCLESLKFPLGKLRLVASERSAGKKVKTPWGEITIEVISEDVFKESDIALFSAGSGISKEWRERVVAANCLMIDNSSAFRYEEDVPLVVPAINEEAARKHKGVIANPNCTTAIAVMALWPLHQKFGLERVIVSTYQATSGAGAKGMQELLDQSKAVLAGEKVEPKEFSHQIAFNLIPHIDVLQENGYTKEEMKVSWETGKIFGEPDLAISCTAVRIPTLRAHSESIVIETSKPISEEAAKEVLAAAPGVELVDDVEALEYPMPINASGKFDVEVGRIRQNLVFGQMGLEFFICGDQLLRGAALNAVEIAKLFI
jgi:aspartate-semialdehyde dehydrogenase